MTTGIEWTDETWNPVVGCSHVSAGCDNCYAAREASGRLKHVPVYAGLASGGKFTGEVRCLPERLEQPLHWTRPRRVFVNSMSDLFHQDVLKATVTDRFGATHPFLAEVFAVMVRAQHHTFQVLTKRPQLMAAVLRHPMFKLDVNACLLRDGHPVMRGGMSEPETPWPSNIWLGTSIENQRYANIRIPYLLDTPAAVRFLSIEPLLGPVDLEGWLFAFCRQPEGECGRANGAGSCDGCAPAEQKIHWVIVGGESGPKARPMHPEWARAVRDRCVEAGVPFHFKQWGEWSTTEQCGVRNHKATARRSHYESARFQPDGTRYLEQGGPDDPREPGGYAAPGMESLVRVGKKAAGRELDGRTWDQYPQAVPA